MKNKKLIFSRYCLFFFIFIMTTGMPLSVFGQTIGLIGPATVNGDLINQVDMEQEEGNPDQWTLNTTLTNGDVYFIEDNNWSTFWGGTTFPTGTGDPSGGAIVATAGDYLVSFNTSTLAYDFSLTSPPPAPSENVGIGTSTPQEKLDVDGNIRFSGELMPDGVAGTGGQVLQSTGDGNMQWADQSSAQGTVGYGTWGDCEMQNITEYFPVCKESGEAPDLFGGSVSIDGNYAIVGAWRDDGPSAIEEGSATIFQHDSVSGTWQKVTELFSPAAQTGDHFAYSVDISGDYAIIGAYQDDSTGGIDQGTVSIYKRNGTNGAWEQQGSKWVNTGAAPDDFFGYSVSISGDYAVVGAVGDDHGLGWFQGSVSFFKRNATTGDWAQLGSKVIHPSSEADDRFGYSVSISGDYAIVGVPYDNGPAGATQGSVCIYKRSPTDSWDLQGTPIFKPGAQPQDAFGTSVSISGDFAIVGAPFDDENGSNAGTVTIIKRDTITGNWIPQGYQLLNYQPDADQQFGTSVAISDDFAMVGSQYANGPSGIQFEGTVVLFQYIGTVWQRLEQITDPAADKNYKLGTSVSLDSQTCRFVIGAPGAWDDMGKVVFGKY